MLPLPKESLFSKIILWGLFFSPFLLFTSEEFTPPANFKDAKKILFPLYLKEHPYTFYCGCRFDSRGIVVSCPAGLEHLEGQRIEWEHIVPASLLAQNLPCWQQDVCPIETQARGKRDCCQKTSESFQYREAQLFNLVPVVSSVNRARSNFRPGWVYHKNRAQHLCGLWIDKKYKRIEPEPHLRGFIARTYLQMYKLYDYPLSKQDKDLFEAWDQQYPEDSWEKSRQQLLNQYYRVDNNR